MNIDAIMTDRLNTFVREHRDEDVHDLALHSGHDDGIDIPFALDQIAGWQKARTKLPTWAACDGIAYPPHLSMEQCSSEATARYKERLASSLTTGDAGPSTLVDLTGGFGVDFSYMAQVFDHATYVERQPLLCDIARHNLPLLGLTHANVVNGDSTDVLGSLEPASMIFLDPARRDDHGARTYAIADCTPDVLALQETMLAKAPVVMVKLSPMLDWHKTVADFDGAVAEVHIVSSGNECKELLLVLTRAHVNAPRVWCVNDDQVLDFDAHPASFAGQMPPDQLPPDQWRYLYKPNASIMKAGCFDVVERRFGVRAVGRNSHLFVAAEPVADFPGRSFVIESIATMNKHELKSLTEGLTHANIAVRNFPMPVAQLRRKLKLKDGGNVYLFATTDARDRHIVIRTVKAATRYSSVL